LATSQIFGLATPLDGIGDLDNMLDQQIRSITIDIL